MIHRYGPLSPVGVLTGRLSTNCIMDDYLSPTSEHPVQNKVIYSALGGKVDKVSGKSLSTNDFTTEYMQKLDSIETGANRTVVDALFVNGSTNPVQSKTIQAVLNAKANAADVTEALANKVDKVYGKVLSSNDFTDAEKAKLANIAAGADKTVVDDTLKSDSVNPVQNRVIHNALALKVDKISGKGLSTNDFTDELKEKLENLTPGGGGGGAVNDVTLDGESVVDDDGVAVLVSPVIHNVPSGGTLGQFLMKASDSDYDTYWGGMLNYDPIFISGTLNASTGVVTVSHLPTTAQTLAMNASSYVIVLRVGARRYYLTDVTGNTLTGPFYFTFSALETSLITEVVSFSSISSSATSMPGQLLTATIPTSKSDIGLGNVDNTSDAAKPISTATQTALDAKVSKPSSPTVGDVLTWDGSAWVASAPTGGSSGVLGVTQDSDGYLVLSPVSAVTEEEVTDTGAVTAALDPNVLYHFTGALTSLTITFAQAQDLAHYHFDFLSGSTAPTLTLPSSVVMPDSFSVEANKRYEVDILNNYGAVMAWTVS